MKSKKKEKHQKRSKIINNLPNLVNKHIHNLSNSDISANVATPGKSGYTSSCGSVKVIPSTVKSTFSSDVTSPVEFRTALSLLLSLLLLLQSSLSLF